MAHGLSCSTACGTFPDQGSNPCPWHWQADSSPLHHQGSPHVVFLCLTFEELPNCFPQQLHHFTFPPALYEGSNFSTSLPPLGFFLLFLIYSHLVSVKWYLIVVLICIFLMASYVEHLFTYLFLFTYYLF